jgi:hypothetical protein
MLIPVPCSTTLWAPIHLQKIVQVVTRSDDAAPQLCPMCRSQQLTHIVYRS